jgi:hypothetical protein
MQLPQINLNGTDGMDLALAYNQAYVALEKAITLMNIPFHGRDYQTLPPEAYQTARREMTERTKAMIAVANDLREIATYCAENAR